ADPEHDALLYKRVVPHQLSVILKAGDPGRVALPVAMLAALGACVAVAADKQPREYLDEDTAATVTVVAEPLVFALPRPELAANVRDYVKIGRASCRERG